ncbi:unnamed protein product [Thlaspi arvense]|uniref:Uncharacterized protein n=1 Tax=Thlaspi arvense TaxID=13288 RepID=A0AAU9RW21_THLAR|nr:unnamed protein product [Thlaspi arvense]
MSGQRQRLGVYILVVLILILSIS